MPRSHEHTAALAIQLDEHLRACSVCKMPIDLKQWDGVILCPHIREWLDLHFPDDARSNPKAPDTPETVAEKAKTARTVADLVWRKCGL